LYDGFPEKVFVLGPSATSPQQTILPIPRYSGAFERPETARLRQAVNSEIVEALIGMGAL
jgi:hypothetical protein